MCTKGRDVINASWWLAFTRNSSFKIKNYNNLSPARCVLKRLPRPLSQGCKLDDRISVARVRPRTSKGITDLLLPRTSVGYAPIVPLRSYGTNPEEFAELFSRSRSRSLTELTRQITPPTKNGHAPPPIESRKIFNLSILTMSGPGKFSRVESN